MYTDYNDSLNSHPDIIQVCIDNKDIDALYGLSCEIFDDQIHDQSVEEFEKIMHKIKGDIRYEKYLGVLNDFDLSDSSWEVRYIIQERDISTPLKDCLKRTEMRCRIELYSNYESLASNWDTRNTYSYDEYFKEMADLLCLNPANIKKEFLKSGLYVTGRWPNIVKRNGQEVVKYEDLAQEMLNQTSYCRLTFMAMLPIMSLYNNDFQTPDFITIPKGNNCGMYSSWVGGGSLLEMTLQRDLKIPYKQMKETGKYNHLDIIVDEKGVDRGCYIDDVYGLVREYWGKELVIEYNEKK